MEYRYAVETGKIVIAFVIDPAIAADLPAEKNETAPQVADLLNKFKAAVMSGRLVRLWTDRSSLSRSVMKSLVAAIDEFPKEGWIRASAAANDEILSQINDLRIENGRLSETNAALRTQLVPKVKNLASIDADYTIPYTFTGYRGATSFADVTLTWRTIFVGVAPHLALGRLTLPPTIIQF